MTWRSAWRRLLAGCWFSHEHQVTDFARNKEGKIIELPKRTTVYRCENCWEESPILREPVNKEHWSKVVRFARRSA